MIDLIYIAVTVGFFGLMLLYAAACDGIGRRAEAERAKDDGR